MPYIGNVTTSSNVNGSQINNGTITGDKLSLPFDYDDATLYLDNTNNRVGIGTTSPATSLEVARLGSEWTGVAPIAGTALFVNSGTTTTTSSARISILSGTASLAAINFGDFDNNSKASIALDNSDDSLQFTVNGSERLRIDSSGRLLVGTSSVAPVNTPKICTATTAIESSLSLAQYRNSTSSSADLDFIKSRSGTVGTAAAVSTTDTISQMRFYGAGDASTYVEAARITAVVDGGTVSATSLAGRLVFSTTADGASSPTERMRINSSGRVGIGTSSPEALLELAANNNTPGTDFLAAYNRLRFTDTDTTKVNSQTTGGIEWYTADSSDPGVYAYISSATTLAGAGWISFATGTNTTKTERVRIDQSGNVGIGTTSPVYKFHVDQGTDDGQSFTVRNDEVSLNVGAFGTGSSYSRQVLINGSRADAGSYPQLRIAGQGGIIFAVDADAERARIDTSGRLLVGTSTARSNFFNSTGTALIQAEGTAGGSSRGMVSIVNNSTSNDGPWLLINKSGGASIGSNTLVSNNDTLGLLGFGGNDGSEFVTAAFIACEVDGTPGANDMPGRLVFSTTADGAASPTERMRIQADGVVKVAGDSWTLGRTYIGNSGSSGSGIGTSSAGANSTTLYIGNAAIQVSSDARLKENIEDTSLDALDAISQIRVKDFTWNDPTDTSSNNRNARGKWTGLIAQELVGVLPFVVNAPRKEADGSIDHESQSTWTLDQSQLCPVLIKAVQQQQEIIASLEARIAALETP